MKLVMTGDTKPQPGAYAPWPLYPARRSPQRLNSPGLLVVRRRNPCKVRAGVHKPPVFALALGLNEVGIARQLVCVVLIKSEGSKHVIRRDLWAHTQTAIAAKSTTAMDAPMPAIVSFVYLRIASPTSPAHRLPVA